MPASNFHDAHLQLAANYSSPDRLLMNVNEGGERCATPKNDSLMSICGWHCIPNLYEWGVFSPQDWHLHV